MSSIKLLARAATLLILTRTLLSILKPITISIRNRFSQDNKLALSHTTFI